MNPTPLRGSLARKERSLGAGYRQAVSAPSKAWRFLQGESPCGVRTNHPLLPSVATATEEGQTEQVS